MKISNYRDKKPDEAIKGVFKWGAITAEDGAPLFTMRIFEVEPNCSTPSHSHPWEHEVFVLSGKGVVAGEQGAIPIGKESVVFIAPDEPHCFVNTANELLRFICVIPLQNE